MSTREARRAKIKKTIRGNKERPRLVVFRSNRYIYAQIVDDSKGETLVSVAKMEDASFAGKLIAEKAREKEIKKVVFDRAGYQYHGSVKRLAEAARKEGLEF